MARTVKVNLTIPQAEAALLALANSVTASDDTEQAQFFGSAQAAAAAARALAKLRTALHDAEPPRR